jgi:hypothetical protein
MEGSTRDLSWMEMSVNPVEPAGASHGYYISHRYGKGARHQCRY